MKALILIVSLSLSCICMAQDTIRATEYFHCTEQIFNSMELATPTETWQKRALSDNRIKNLVLQDLRQFVDTTELILDSGPAKQLETSTDSCTATSTVVLQEGNEGFTFVNHLHKSSTTAFFKTDRDYSHLFHRRYQLDLLGSHSFVSALHDPSLTVSERNIISGSPAVTLARLEAWFKGSIQDTVYLGQIIETSFQQYFPTLWVRDVAVSEDSVQSATNDSTTRTSIVAVGTTDDSFMKTWIVFHIDLLTSKEVITRLESHIEISSEPSPSIMEHNRRIRPVGGGDCRRIIVRVN